MPWMDILKLSGAFAVPLAAVAGLFYGIMSAALTSELGKIENNINKIQDNVEALRSDVHALDVRLARLEERIPPRQ